MFKITILEDEEFHANNLLTFLKQFKQEHPPFHYTAKHYSQPIELLSEYQCDTDLIFIDINLPDIKGIEVAQRIRDIDQQVMIIFVTSLTQYAIEGYSVRAFDYILKPLSYTLFSRKLERAIQILAAKEDNLYINVRTKNGCIRLASDSILYIEILNHDVTLHTDQGTITHWGSLSKYENLLQNAHFARCSSCYLVNLKFIQHIDQDYVEVANQRLAISKSKKKSFLAALAQYKGGSY